MTIKDIAKLADVSVSTVSRVLNDRPDVSEDSRRRVRAVIEAHRYVPNNSARDLVKIRSDAVGLVVRGVQNPFYTDIIHAIEQKLDASGYTMVMRQIPSGDDEIQCGAVMEKEKRLRGIIFLGGRSDYSPEEVSLLGVPYVCCSYTNSYGMLPPESYSSVSIADEQEAYRAVSELYKNGHRRIAVLTAAPDDSSISQLRYLGYQRALRDFGLTEHPEDLICAEDFTIANAYAAMQKRLRPRRFYGCLRHCGRHGHWRDARPARKRPLHPRGLLRHRHRRHQRLGIHSSHAHHPLPAHDRHGRGERRDPARHHRGARRSSPRHSADRAARGRVRAAAQALIFPREPRENKFEKEY